MSIKPIIALDADGVLLDYGLAYASVWERAFGQRPVERDKDAYLPYHRWAVDFLAGDRLAALRACMDEHFWSCVPPLERAVDACHGLYDAGYELVCVSALAPQFEAARLRNLRDAGFPIERVIATGVTAGERSPKAEAIEHLAPVAFVDDLLPYFRIAPGVHRALICRSPNGTPTSDRNSIRSIPHTQICGHSPSGCAALGIHCGLNRCRTSWHTRALGKRSEIFVWV